MFLISNWLFILPFLIPSPQRHIHWPSRQRSLSYLKLCLTFYIEIISQWDKKTRVVRNYSQHTCRARLYFAPKLWQATYVAIFWRSFRLSSLRSSGLILPSSKSWAWDRSWNTEARFNGWPVTVESGHVSKGLSVICRGGINNKTRVSKGSYVLYVHDNQLIFI